MHIRKRNLLHLIHLAGGSIDRLRLVKLMFLYSRSGNATASTRYDFVPYQHGPFSFSLYHDWQALVEAGLGYEPSSGEFALTAEGARIAANDNGAGFGALDDVHLTWSSRATNELIEHAYAMDPWFAIRSDRDGGRFKRALPNAPTRIYTVGYQRMSVDRFLNLLLRRGIRALVDTRMVPVSRVYGYHANTLARLCGRVGIEYNSERELGVPGDVRNRFRQTGDRDWFVAEYNEILRTKADALGRVADAVAQAPTAVMCYEENIDACHRKPLADTLASMTGLECLELRDD